MKQLLPFCILTLFLFGTCTEPPVVFTEAQPSDIPEEPYFNMIYRGIFFCESDSATVFVKAKTIYKERAYTFSISKAEIDSIPGARLEGQTLYIEGFEDPIQGELINDTLYSDIMLRDTLFDMGVDQ